MTRRLRVAVIAGGQNSEHEISLASAAGVSAALTGAGHHPMAFTIGVDGVWMDDKGIVLAATPVASLATALHRLAVTDVVFPVVHGRLGEDGAIAALLELAGIPYVGCGIRAGAIGIDKRATKAIAASLGLRVAPGVVLLPGDGVPDLDPPLVVKPTTGGSSHGVTLVDDRRMLARAIEKARAVGETVLVERFISGREIHIGVVERADGSRLIPPPIEFVVAPGTVFDTTRKYDGTTTTRLPAEGDPATLMELRGAAGVMFDALGCRGFARFDFLVTDEGAVLNEINTTPGMTEHSGFPMMCAAAGLDYPTLVDELVRGSLLRT